jgi:hypothetical protein
MASYGNFPSTIHYPFLKVLNVNFLPSDYYPVDSTAKSSRSGCQRHFYDEVQLELLDAEFARDSFPNREGRRRIAQLIGVSEKSNCGKAICYNLLN